jgi:UDP-2-acetamido-3-amino-2,3-dideoxy-glucuronate N-acetyltransferase
MNPRSHVSRKTEYRRTLVRQGATIGANATVVCGNTIGRYAFVAAGAVVAKDVASYALVMGVPARLSGWVCYCGVRLPLAVDNSGSETCTCPACGKTYRREGEQVTPCENE